jgi:hypothetical protein
MTGSQNWHLWLDRRAIERLFWARHTIWQAFTRNKGLIRRSLALDLQAISLDKVSQYGSE